MIQSIEVLGRTLSFTDGEIVSRERSRGESLHGPRAIEYDSDVLEVAGSFGQTGAPCFYQFFECFPKFSLFR
jgi:hypothetical protein